jgi:hypothetical protein
MPIKAVETIRKIRDRHYEEMKDLSPQEQIRYIRKKSQKLQAWLEKTGAKKVARGGKKR